MALTTEQRGYGWAHRKKRAALLFQAYGQPCTRCGQPMLPGQALHLDHTEDRMGYLGFAHARCNRRAGARLGARRRWGNSQRAVTSRRW